MTSLVPYPHSFEHRMSSPKPLFPDNTIFFFPLRCQTLLRIHSRSPDARSSPALDRGGFGLRLACIPGLIGGSWWHLNRISGSLPTLVATGEGARMQTWACQSMLALQGELGEGRRATHKQKVCADVNLR